MSSDDQLAILETVGHVALDDTLRETLDDRGLADARLADQHRIILGAARQYLDHAPNLFVASDYRIDLAGRGELGQVATIFFERLISRLGIRRRDALIAADLLQHGHQLVVGQAGLAQNFCCRAGFVEHRDQHVLDRHVFVLEFARFLLGAREHAAQALGRINLPAVGAAAALPAESCASSALSLRLTASRSTPASFRIEEPAPRCLRAAPPADARHRRLDYAR